MLKELLPENQGGPPCLGKETVGTAPVPKLHPSGADGTGDCPSAKASQKSQSKLEAAPVGLVADESISASIPDLHKSCKQWESIDMRSGNTI